MPKSIRVWLGLLIMAVSFQLSAVCCFAEDYLRIPCAIQVSSRVSDGKYSLQQIIDIARANKVKALVIAERDLMRWEYGIFPLENVIKKTVENNSLSRYGIKKYLDEFAAIQKSNSDIILVPGIESSPYYYWQGSPIEKNLSLVDWHKHLLTIGLNSPRDIQALPVAGNRPALAIPYSFKNLVLVWPLAIIALGFLLFNKREFSYCDSRGRPLGRYSRKSRIIGALTMAVGILFYINDPFLRSYKFSQYSGDLGILPYQNYIDYVLNKGGLVYWSHPEARNVENSSGIAVKTQEHPENLLLSKNYTGYAVFYEGYKKIGVPGGLWDQLLLEYCQNKRGKPVWAIGALSYDNSGKLEYYFKELRTVLLVKEPSARGCLEALGAGRNYVVQSFYSEKFVLDKFIIRGERNNLTMGEEARLSAPAVVELGGYLLNGQEGEFEIKLIRNGKVIKVFKERSPFDISYRDDLALEKNKCYYRAEIKANGFILITNPIFVEYI